MKEFFGPQVGSKTSLCNNIISQFKRHPGGNGRIGSLGNVSKGAAMYQCRRIFECLHKIGVYGIPQQHLHSSLSLNIRYFNRIAPVGESYYGTGKPFAKILIIIGKAKHCHNLRSRCDIKTIGTGYAMTNATQSHKDFP